MQKGSVSAKLMEQVAVAFAGAEIEGNGGLLIRERNADPVVGGAEAKHRKR